MLYWLQGMMIQKNNFHHKLQGDTRRQYVVPFLLHVVSPVDFCVS